MEKEGNKNHEEIQNIESKNHKSKKEIVDSSLRIRKLTTKDFTAVFPIGFQFYKEHFYARLYSLEKLLEMDPDHGCYVGCIEIDGEVTRIFDLNVEQGKNCRLHNRTSLYSGRNPLRR